MTDPDETRRSIRVVLADDHPVVLAGIRALLQSEDIDVVGEATTGTEALELIRSTSPDVAVIDISMPELNGIELTERLAEQAAGVHVIAMTVHEDRAYVQPLLRKGARGYLLKRSAAEDLVRAVRAVADGGVYLDPAVAETALQDPVHTSGSDADLSPRETDVLRFIAQGFSNKEVAARLDVSVKTVETYNTNGPHV